MDGVPAFSRKGIRVLEMLIWPWAFPKPMGFQAPALRTAVTDILLIMVSTIDHNPAP